MSLYDIRRQLRELQEAGASEEELDQFLSEEGVSLDPRVPTMARTDKKLDAHAEHMNACVADLADKLGAAADVLTAGLGELGHLVSASGQQGAETLSQRVQEASASLTASVRQSQKALATRLVQLQADVVEMKAEQAKTAGMFELLMTARRVPVRDKSGDLIAVKLEAH